MASVEEATGLLASTTTLLGDFALNGTATFLANALAPATMSKIMDISKGDVAQSSSAVGRSGGSTGRRRADVHRGTADPATVFVDTTGGGRGIRVMHPTLGVQCIPTTALRHYSGFLAGITRNTL